MSNSRLPTHISDAIRAIRAAAGDPGIICPTCGRLPAEPLRGYDDQLKPGQDRLAVRFGCVDAFHTDHLEAGTPSYGWHYRQEAIEARGQTLARLREASRIGTSVHYRPK